MTATPEIGTEVRIAARTHEAVRCLRDGLQDFWVTADGLELVVATANSSFKDGLTPILAAIHRCLEEHGIGPVTLVLDDRRYTMYAESEK